MSTFGPEFEQVWPKTGSELKLSEFGKDLLQKCSAVEKPNTDANHIDLNEFMKVSSNFPLEFGTNTCRVMSQPKERHTFIKQQIASAYPVIHERVLGLYLSFLEHKCKYGTQMELSLYKGMSLTDLVQRLLDKRCVVFVGAMDSYLLLSGKEGFSGFDDVGTADEKPPIVLKDVLSYDEIKLSAFLSVSSHTEFLNDGRRRNAGIVETNKSKIEPAGVVIGLIGPRFQRRNFMEWQDVIITPEQNTEQNGYGQENNKSFFFWNPYKNGGNPTRAADYRRLWTNFYEEADMLFTTAKHMKSPRFFHTPRSQIFDNVMLGKRYAISFDTLLLEAEARAAALSKQAYIHVVGIGLGTWRAVDHQPQIFLETFTQRTKTLISKLPHIGVLHFSWIGMSECGELKDDAFFACDTHPNGGIKTFLSNRNPGEKLKSPDYDNMLVVVSFAWDANALPGNEFWEKSLTSSCDPSTACSTLISELHNPHVNKEMVNGNNLHIASEKYGVLHVSEYAAKVLS